MNLELDHVIVCCDPGAPEAAALTAAGMTEGSGNDHVGQGTANRRFFFHNAYLELLWVSDLEQARREPARRTRLWERWLRRQDAASPFGVALRPTDPEAVDAPPFPIWAYHAPYLPARVSIGIALATPLAVPEFLYVNFATRPESKRREPIDHPGGFVRLTGVRFAMPNATGTQTLAAKVASDAGLVSFSDAPDRVVHLTFDDGARAADLRPTLPIVLHY